MTFPLFYILFKLFQRTLRLLIKEIFSHINYSEILQQLNESLVRIFVNQPLQLCHNQAICLVSA